MRPAFVAASLLTLLSLGCESRNAEVTAVDSGTPGHAPRPPARADWAALGPGEALLGVKFSEMNWASFQPDTHELNVSFRGTDAACIDDQSAARRLSAVKVGEVPAEYERRCGPNHGGDFQVQNARYGVYANLVRIYDASPAGVRLLLGDEFVHLLDGCDLVKVGKMCRTPTHLRVGVGGGSMESIIVAEDRRFERLVTDAPGWQTAKLAHWSRAAEFDHLSVKTQEIDCVFSLPPLSEPSACGLEGEDYREDPCPKSDDCAAEGRCASVDGTCVALLADDCVDSKGCKEEGRCELAGHACVATADGCRARYACARSGACSVVDGRCGAVGDDCAASTNCAEDGLCTAQQGVCIASDRDCRGAKACREQGDCSAVDGVCVSANDGDCKQSQLCKKSQACGFANGKCTQTTEAQCRRTKRCKEDGFCLLAPDGAGCRACATLDPDWPPDGWLWSGGKCRKMNEKKLRARYERKKRDWAKSQQPLLKKLQKK